MKPVTLYLWNPERPKPKQSARFGRGGKAVFPDRTVVMAERTLRKVMRKEIRRLQMSQPYLGPVTLEVLFLKTGVA